MPIGKTLESVKDLVFLTEAFDCVINATPQVLNEKNYMLLRFLFLLSFCFHCLTHAQDLASNDHEIHVALISPELERSLISHPNFSSQATKLGNCFGIDRLNYTILTNVSFVAGGKDSPATIQRKLLIAYEQLKVFFKERNKQVIQGFATADDFYKEMEQTWDNSDNPLRRAIEKIQVQMEGVQIIPRMTMKQSRQGQQVNVVQEEVQDLVNYIMMEVPIRIHLGTHPPHVVTMIGFKLNLDKTTGIQDFYVLDSNFPRTFQILSLKKLENKNKSLEYFWIYGLPTQTGDMAYFKMKSLSWDEPFFPEEQKAAQDVFDVNFYYKKLTIKLTENEIKDLIKYKVSVSGQ